MEIQIIQNKIVEIRSQKVLLDRDLAEIYGVQTKVLNQAVKRNIERFEGEDFMFQLSKKEVEKFSRSQIATLNDVEIWKSQTVITTENDLKSQDVISSENSLRSQIVTLKSGRGQHRKYAPYAFTQLGVAMLSSVLNSKVAIEANRNIMRAFVMIQQFALNYKDLADKLREMEEKYDRQFININEAITYLMQKDKIEIEQKNRRRIGFVQNEEK